MKIHRPQTAALLLLAACTQDGGEPGSSRKAPVNEPPAKVQVADRPGGLATVVLEPQAEERLGVRTVPAELRAVSHARTLGADVVLPPGRSITVSAPVAGTLRVAESAPAPSAGSSVAAGETLFELVALLSPERDVLTPAEGVQAAKTQADLELARVRAAGDLELARARLEVARIAVARAETLVESEAGSVRARDEARAELAMAKGAFAAAQSSVDALAAVSLEPREGEQQALPIAAPIAGTLVALRASPGQLVSAGAALFDVAALDPVWIRVPVYVGDLDEVDAAREALVGSLSGRTDTPLRPARPVAAPPSANPAAASVDLWYELSNADGSLRPGQRLAATLALRGEEESLVVPWSAVLYDAHDGAWVYVQTAPHAFSRRAVDVRRVSDGLAVLGFGPPPGAAVVVAGVAELHGIEVGADR